MSQKENSNSPSDCNDHPEGELALGVAGEGSLRWAAVDLGQLLDELRRRVDLSPIATVALGRTLTAATLLHRFTLKNPGKIVVEVAGDGPLGRVVGELGDTGHLRGYVSEPRYEGAGNPLSSLGHAIGKGFLKVLRTTTRKRYESQVELVSGEIGEDLVHYLEQSEQIRSAAFFGEVLGPDGVGTAGGMLVEALPGVSEEVLSQLESNIAGLSGVQNELARGGLEGLTGTVLSGLDRKELERHPVRYGCEGGRDRIAGHLMTLSPDDLDHLVDARDRFTAECAYCGLGYTFSRSEIELTN